MTIRDATRRFDGRAGPYARHRPLYPPGIVETLIADCGLTPSHVVADIGAGTGILAELVLRHGNPVIAVEPNDSMRASMGPLQRYWPSLRVVAGAAEATTLADASVDFVVVGQAFHWFDPQRTRLEFGRILRPGGRVALVWNVRDKASTSFLRGYEAVLDRHAPDYARLKRGPVDLPVLAEFFAPGGYREHGFAHAMTYDLEGLQGLLASTSYAPPAGTAGHAPLMEALATLFAATSVEGRVSMQYRTRLFCSA